MTELSSLQRVDVDKYPYMFIMMIGLIGTNEMVEKTKSGYNVFFFSIWLSDLSS